MSHDMDFSLHDVSTGTLDISSTWQGIYDDADFMFHLLTGLDEKREFFQAVIKYHFTTDRKEYVKTYTLGNHYGGAETETVPQYVSDTINVYDDELKDVELIIKQYTQNIESGLFFTLPRGQFHITFVDEVKKLNKGEYFMNKVLYNIKTYRPGFFELDTDATATTMLSALQTLTFLKKVISEFPFVVGVTKMR